MKRTVISLVMITFIAAITITSLSAQTVPYTWKKYGISFAIPKTHDVSKNSTDEFESGDEQTWLQMFPFTDGSETAQGMIEKVAAQGKFSIEEEGEYTSGGYDGYWLQCSSATYPEWQYWLIGFIDPASETNFYSIIWWKKGDDAAYKIAYDMSYSFKKMK